MTADTGGKHITDYKFQKDSRANIAFITNNNVAISISNQLGNDCKHRPDKHMAKRCSG